MNNKRKQLILINGSPKPDKEQSVSEALITRLDGLTKARDLDTVRINARQSILKKNEEKDFELISQADALIFVFPLYIFCLPGVLMQYLQELYEYWSKLQDKGRRTKIYAVVNCGFSEAYINEEAIRVIKSFSRQIRADFRFGVSIGGGGMILGAQGAPFMKKTFSCIEDAFQRILGDLMEDKQETVSTIEIPINIPRWLYYFFAQRGWISMGRENGLKKKNLYRKPYYNN